MAWFNANFFHSLGTYVIAGLGAVTTAAIWTGCTETTVALECSKSFLPPTVTIPAIAAIALVKVVISLVRDGPLGMFKEQPPVVTTLPQIPVTVVDKATGQKVNYTAKTR